MPNGPVVPLCRPEDVPAMSRLLGIPVTGNGRDGLHDERCGGCQGKATSQTCPYSVRRREHLTRSGEEGGPTGV